jgi:hypothetical protein
MTTIIVFVAVLLIATKSGDVLTTLIYLKTPEGELNPAVNRLMKRFGIQTTVWSIFLLLVMIVLVTAYATAAGSMVARIGFITLGTLISFLHVCVAYNNWLSGKGRVSQNIVIRSLKRFFYRMSRTKMFSGGNHS